MFKSSVFFDEHSGRSLWKKKCAAVDTRYVSRHPALPNSVSHVRILQCLHVHKCNVTFCCPVVIAVVFSAVAEQINFHLDDIASRFYNFIQTEKKFGMIEKSDIHVRHWLSTKILVWRVEQSPKRTNLVPLLTDASAEGSPLLQACAVFPEARTCSHRASVLQCKQSYSHLRSNCSYNGRLPWVKRGAKRPEGSSIKYYVSFILLLPQLFVPIFLYRLLLTAGFLCVHAA